MVGKSGRLAAKAVGSFVPKLTQRAFEKYGFTAGVLLTDWSAIAGREIARFTVPERLVWPRSGVETRIEGAETSRAGAILFLNVDPARALEMQYQRAAIADRVNGYFGYAAIASVRIVQTAWDHRGSDQGTTRDPGSEIAATHGPPAPIDVEDEGLRAALVRLGASIAAGSRRPARSHAAG